MALFDHTNQTDDTKRAGHAQKKNRNQRVFSNEVRNVRLNVIRTSYKNKKKKIKKIKTVGRFFTSLSLFNDQCAIGPQDVLLASRKKEIHGKLVGSILFGAPRVVRDGLRRQARSIESVEHWQALVFDLFDCWNTVLKLAQNKNKNKKNQRRRAKLWSNTKQITCNGEPPSVGAQVPVDFGSFQNPNRQKKKKNLLLPQSASMEHMPLK